MIIKQKVRKPLMPNEIFFELEQNIGKKQDGFNPTSGKISVKDLTSEEANEYAELMKQTFIEHWTNLIDKNKIKQ